MRNISLVLCKKFDGIVSVRFLKF